jgi:enamine deaminase RidA (YjgF/YER057c/UK114 family)
MAEPLVHRSTITRVDTSPRYSEVVIHGGPVIYLAGQVPDEASLAGGFSAQCVSVFAQITALLLRAGSSVDRVLTMTIYLTDIRFIKEMNEVFETWCPEGSAPARATVGVSSLADPRWLIEVSCQAAL